MRAGRLRHRIELQADTATTDDADSFGEVEPSWETYAEVYADVRPLVGTERYAAQQVQASVSHEIRIRFRADVLDTHRVRWVCRGTARLFDINAVLNVEERDRELLLLCTEATA